MTISHNRSKIELDFITALEKNHQVSQNKLAQKIGIAVGLVNILMKRAVERGYIKMHQIPARRYAYYLTARGFSEKTKLVARYLDNSLHLYRKLRVEYQDIFCDLEAKGNNEIILVGDIDIAEIAIMASFNHGITIKSLLNNETNKSRIGSTPVYKKLDAEYKGSVVICDSRTPQACFDKLAEQVDPQQIFYPKVFCIRDINSPNGHESI
jgi:DNA-binding MarR family transcriptional regulator